MTGWKLGLALAALATLLSVALWLACAPAPRAEHPGQLEIDPAAKAEPAAKADPAAKAEPAARAEPAAKAAIPAAAQPAADPHAEFMQRLRTASDADPVLALQLARDDERDNPDSRDAAERSALMVKSLARQGRLSEARGEAEKLVSRYPDTRWALEVEQQTGAHPRRNQ